MNIIDTDGTAVKGDVYYSNTTGDFTIVPGIGTVIGTGIGTYNIKDTICNGSGGYSYRYANKMIAAFNLIMYDDSFRYISEKDMPDDVFINYCLFKNKMKELFNKE